MVLDGEAAVAAHELDQPEAGRDCDLGDLLDRRAREVAEQDLLTPNAVKGAWRHAPAARSAAEQRARATATSQTTATSVRMRSSASTTSRQLVTRSMYDSPISRAVG